MKSTIPRGKQSSTALANPRMARTKLGGLLRRIRGDIVASGAPLLNWRELDQEIDRRKGNRNGEARQ